jgi:hypothetical protein
LGIGIFPEKFPTCLPAGRRALLAVMTPENKHSNIGKIKQPGRLNQREVTFYFTLCITFAL